jgi:uncharacterized protein (DUF2147 family)
MKNVFRLIGIIALIAVIGFSLAGCGDAEDGSTGGGGGTTTYSLAGIWKSDAGNIVNITGSTGVYIQIEPTAVWQSAVSKGYLKVGDQLFRNLSKTGDLTWTGQWRYVWSNPSAPNVATSVSWENCTITMAANGLTFNVGTTTFTKTTLSLDGVWESDAGNIVNITGSNGVYIQIEPTAVWQSAVSKGYIRIGDQLFRNLSKTGDLAWTGQWRYVWSNPSAPNVATSVSWENCTITMAANGLTFNVGTTTFTRK